MRRHAACSGFPLFARTRFVGKRRAGAPLLSLPLPFNVNTVDPVRSILEGRALTIVHTEFAQITIALHISRRTIHA